ncbi:hypothetical protein SADUNF_Sadunf06G0055200 [Salix dunnii]|uniref:Uncharacterized protein n=1 Tax=Salix dunnii TaxID=1413687 RepID=A0A835K0S9_9ROSI|nr:hypothetical protein SADUNF_Sadunf06G0055200 [Salix dunnii]
MCFVFLCDEEERELGRQQASGSCPHCGGLSSSFSVEGEIQPHFSSEKAVLPWKRSLPHDGAARRVLGDGEPKGKLRPFNMPELLILSPFFAYQGVNARVFEEMKKEKGYTTRDSAAESLRLVMEKEEGKIYREKAEEMKLYVVCRQKSTRQAHRKESSKCSEKQGNETIQMHEKLDRGAFTRGYC